MPECPKGAPKEAFIHGLNRVDILLLCKIYFIITFWVELRDKADASPSTAWKNWARCREGTPCRCLVFPGRSVKLKAAVLIGHWGVERFTVLLCLLKVF